VQDSFDFVETSRDPDVHGTTSTLTGTLFKAIKTLGIAHRSKTQRTERISIRLVSMPP
jgi:hypothetical protein